MNEKVFSEIKMTILCIVIVGFSFSSPWPFVLFCPPSKSKVMIDYTNSNKLYLLFLILLLLFLLNHLQQQHCVFKTAVNFDFFRNRSFHKNLLISKAHVDFHTLVDYIGCKKFYLYTLHVHFCIVRSPFIRFSIFKSVVILLNHFSL